MQESREPFILTVTSPDQPGLVAAIATLLHTQGANITEAAQHSAAATEHFFQRIEFTLDPERRQTLEQGMCKLGEKLQLDWRLISPNHRERIAIFVSQQLHCLIDLLLRYESGELECQLSFVASNHTAAHDVCKRHDVDFYHFPISKDTKNAQEACQLELLDARRVDLVVLARYMQVLTPTFVEKQKNSIINIHHSFLPAFVGGQPYHQAYKRGVKLIGATAHYVTEDLDQGPIIEQAVVQTAHRDEVGDLIRKGRDLERITLAKAVRWHLENRVFVHMNKTIVFY